MGSLLSIVKYLKPYGLKSLVAIVLVLISSLLTLLMPYLGGVIIDQGVAAEDLGIVMNRSLLMLAAAILSSLISFGGSILAIQASLLAGRDLRRDLFNAVSRFSFAHFDRWRTGEILVRINSDVRSLSMFLRMVLLMLVSSVAMIVGSVAAMFLSSPEMAWKVLLLLGGAFSLFLILAARIKPLYLLVREKLDALNNHIQENLAGAKLVRALSRQEDEIFRFGVKNREFRGLSVKVGLLFSTLIPIIILAGNMAIFAVLRIGGTLVARESELSLGGLVAFQNYVATAIFPLSNLVMMAQFFSMALASAERVLKIRDEKPEVVESPDAVVPESFSGSVEFRHVDFHYGEGEAALKDISFSVKAGERVGIIGPTGSGKSSMAHLMARYYDSVSGEVRVSDHSVKDLALSEVRSRVLVALQEAVLFSGTLKENFCFGTDEEDKDRISRVARLVQAEEFILAKEQGWESRIGERGIRLSGGERQRMAIGRALMAKPDVLVLDDATSAMDSETENRVLDSLASEFGGMTLFLISQRVSAVKRMDRILVLNRGRLESRGTHDELMQSSPVYRELAESQSVKM